MKQHSKFLTVVPAMIALAITFSTAHAQEAANRPAAQRSEGAAGGASLTDGQVLQIVRTLNDGEIKQAKEAVDESDNQEVKSVAQMIITDHESSNDQMDDLLSGDLDLDDSPLSETLKSQAEKTHEELQDLSGAEYDCAYLQKQVEQHEMAISTSKTQLVPNAKNAAVTQFLTAMGPKLEHHLEMAKTSLGKVASCK